MRQAVAHLQEVFEVSQRRACAVLGADRTMVRYVSRRHDDAKARERIRELASQRRRFGYRRLHWLLCREGWAMNHKKFRRLYREERLTARLQPLPAPLEPREPNPGGMGTRSSLHWRVMVTRS
jgi:putative transposase